jgi:hypothetical protein
MNHPHGVVVGFRYKDPPPQKSALEYALLYEDDDDRFILRRTNGYSRTIGVCRFWMMICDSVEIHLTYFIHQFPRMDSR